MTIDPHHFARARELMPDDVREPRSQAFQEGWTYAMAWCLAGRPAPTETRNKDRDCPYPHRSAERDAWFWGWGSGKRVADRNEVGR
jgi:hypothetical protein